MSDIAPRLKPQPAVAFRAHELGARGEHCCYCARHFLDGEEDVYVAADGHGLVCVDCQASCDRLQARPRGGP